jgi:hypothetical protein
VQRFLFARSASPNPARAVSNPDEVGRVVRSASVDHVLVSNLE